MNGTNAGAFAYMLVLYGACVMGVFWLIRDDIQRWKNGRQ